MGMESGDSLSEVDNQETDHANSVNEDIIVLEAVNRFVSSREQTYEEFVNGFTYLTMEDLSKEENKTKATAPLIIPENSLTATNSTRKHDGNDNEDELEEELLEDCQGTGTLYHSSSSGRSQVKFDNFVEVESDNEEIVVDEDLKDILSQSSYSASFNEVSPGETTQCPETTAGVRENVSWPMIEKSEFVEETNFGEVEVRNNISPQKNSTFLDITTVYLNQESSFNLNHQVDCNEVEVFNLDPDFDYDNVKLTPKFSPCELQIHTDKSSEVSG